MRHQPSPFPTTTASVASPISTDDSAVPRVPDSREPESHLHSRTPLSV
jgi:hypothetical protein